MTNVKRNRLSMLIGLTVLLVSFLIVLNFPSVARAAALGNEAPELYFQYYNSDGDEVDGNNLSAGTYNVNIMLSGIENISTVEVTATYDSSVTLEQATPSQLLSDNVTNMNSMGYILDNGKMVFGFVSTEDASTSLGGDVLLASFAATFTDSCDAADVISVLDNPNLTFVQADYNDGYDNEYAINTQYADYNGSLYPMTADVSPAQGTDTYNVNGSIVIMTDPVGNTNGVAVSGEYMVDVFSDENRTNLVKTVQSTEFVDQSGVKSNTFVIENLSDGIYYLTISSKYAISRDDITLIVNGADISASKIPIIACNFNGDEYINSDDALIVYSFVGFSNESYNLNGDEYINGDDALIVYSCGSSALKYNSITIQ